MNETLTITRTRMGCKEERTHTPECFTYSFTYSNVKDQSKCAEVETNSTWSLLDDVQSFGDTYSTQKLEFDLLVEEWQRERGIASSGTKIVLSSAYQKIIAMGKSAIPLILARLRAEGEDPDHWFWALRMLTRQNPVPREHRGNMAAMATDWLQWAEDNGW